MGVMGEAGGGVGVMESSGQLFLDQGDRIATGCESLSQVAGVSVQVFGTGTDAPPPGSKGIGNRAFGRNGVAPVVMQVLLMVGGFDVDGGVELTLVDVNIDIQESDMAPGGVHFIWNIMCIAKSMYIDSRFLNISRWRLGVIGYYMM